MAMTRKQHKQLNRHKAIVKERNIRNNNQRYSGVRPFRWGNHVFRLWAI